MIITEHAEHRSRERLGIPRKAVPRTALKALKHGIRADDFTGPIRRFLDGRRHNNGGDYIVYGQHLFVFKGETLVTVFQLPAEFRDYKKWIAR